MSDRPQEYDMFDNNCLDYGPYTPSEASLKSEVSDKEQVGSRSAYSRSTASQSPSCNSEDFVVVDQVEGSDDGAVSDPRPEPIGPHSDVSIPGDDVRRVVNVGVYFSLTSGTCSVPEAACFGSEQQASGGPSGDVERFQPEQLTPAGKRIRSCPVCFKPVDRPRRHILRAHVPWFWMPTTACWKCKKQEAQRGKTAINHTLDHEGGFTNTQMQEWCELINGALFKLANWLECDTLEDLLQHVLSHRLYQGVRSDFNEDEMLLLHFYAEHYSDNHPITFTVNPPNHVICLINWELVSVLMVRVGAQRLERFRNSHRRLTSTGMNVVAREPVEGLEDQSWVDSHFHLDLILKNGRFNDFQHLQRVVTEVGYQDCLYFGVTNYVFPSNWDLWQAQIAGTTHLQVTFGIHPHVAAEGVSRSRLDTLDKLLSNAKCVAVGEIGLDDTTKCHCAPCRDSHSCRMKMRRNQEEAFINMLFLARDHNLPVVLHCRDDASGYATNRTLEIIQEVGLAGLKYYRHCFTGNYEELQAWRVLSQIRFGISWKTVEDVPDSVARMTSNEILLETDSPFLSPFPECRINHPWNLDVIAKEVCRIRNIPTYLLWTTANQNAIDFYGLHHMK